MTKGKVVVLRQRTPRYTPAMACEAWMEISERARRMVAFAEAELLHSFAHGDMGRRRTLQALHADAAEGKAQPGHGVAA